ncbi:MAG: (2Fe-2S) ferredoxin domain-containing protein, partial [Clostridia bacterium]|nr:(2Fe-2S) ferredoxin domain-containing protein [Clostridia bacterium]
GSRKIVEVLQDLIRTNNLDEKVELGGTFCIGQCQKGVCVTVGEEVFSVSPETVKEFFEENILAKVK